MSEAEQIARAIERALRPDFPERGPTVQLFAELLLDSVEAALQLTQGAPAAPALAQLELLASGADIYSWEAPGWDAVLWSGLGPAGQPLSPGPSLLDGLGGFAGRDAQRTELTRRARVQAARLVEAGRNLGREGSASALIETHAALCRLFGLAAAAPLLMLPEDLQAGALATEPAWPALIAELDERARAGSEFASAGEEWLARLLAQNPAAAHPAFRRFFAGLTQALRVTLVLRQLRDQARSGEVQLAQPDLEALLGALGGYQPVRWQELRLGVPAGWFAQLCPAPEAGERPLERLARESSAALDLAGRLWLARGMSLTSFAALASLFTARCASLAALCEELAPLQDPEAAQDRPG